MVKINELKKKIIKQCILNITIKNYYYIFPVVEFYNNSEYILLNLIVYIHQSYIINLK